MILVGARASFGGHVAPHRFNARRNLARRSAAQLLAACQSSENANRTTSAFDASRGGGSKRWPSAGPYGCSSNDADRRQRSLGQPNGRTRWVRHHPENAHPAFVSTHRTGEDGWTLLVRSLDLRVAGESASSYRGGIIGSPEIGKFHKLTSVSLGQPLSRSPSIRLCACAGLPQARSASQTIAQMHYYAAPHEPSEITTKETSGCPTKRFNRNWMRPQRRDSKPLGPRWRPLFGR